MNKLISVVTPCFNEEENVPVIYERVKQIFGDLPYRYEHIFIDNASTDGTVGVLRSIAKQDRNVKLILNSRNFGHIRSPYYAMTQARGDAVVSLVADLQDPPEMIREFLKKWEEGYKVVVGEKSGSQEMPLVFGLRQFYYDFVTKIADVKLVKNFTGFGLYDRQVVDILRQIKDPYPYFRGLIAEIGFDVAAIPYNQPVRKKGVTKNNFYSLYDLAMLGITSHSKVPIRVATIAGFCLSGISLMISLVYLILKLLLWNVFKFGFAPLLIGIFFFSSVQLFFIGLIGEYIAAIHTHVLNRPLVVEKERINFE